MPGGCRCWPLSGPQRETCGPKQHTKQSAAMENRTHTARWPPQTLPLSSPASILPTRERNSGREEGPGGHQSRLHWQLPTPTSWILLLMSFALLCTVPRTAYSITRTFWFMFSRVRAFFSWLREVVMHLARWARARALTDHHQRGYANAIVLHQLARRPGLFHGTERNGTGV